MKTKINSPKVPENPPASEDKGGINRERKYVYQTIAATRHKLNKVTVQEPTMNDFNNPTI